LVKVKELSPGDAALKILRKQRYVSTDELKQAVEKAGYTWRRYSASIAELRDRDFVIVWVWELRRYTMKPNFVEVYRWCLSNYKSIATILRRTKPALGQGHALSKLLRQKVYDDAKKHFLAVYRHMKGLDATNKKHPNVMAA